MSGVLYIVATPIGNLEDMSYRAVRVLGSAHIIAAEDTRSAARLLNHFVPTREHRVDDSESEDGERRGARVLSFFEGNEAARTETLIAALREGANVALISEAGTPGISDPGERLIAAAIAAGARVEVIPGPVAAVAALVGSGLPTGRFLFLGFPPREPGARQELFGSLRHERATMIFYEAPDRVAATLADLAAAFGDTRPAALARELTKRYEEYVREPLGILQSRYRAEPPRGECTLVVGGAEEEAQHAIDIEAEVRALLDQGLGPKDVAGRLVIATGKPRRQLYQLALALKRERDERS